MYNSDIIRSGDLRLATLGSYIVFLEFDVVFFVKATAISFLACFTFILF